MARWLETSSFDCAQDDAGRRATALTRQLLAFSRRQPLDPKPVNVNRLVTGMSELLASLDPPAPPRSRLRGMLSSQVSSAGMMSSQVASPAMTKMMGRRSAPGGREWQ